MVVGAITTRRPGVAAAWNRAAWRRAAAAAVGVVGGGAVVGGGLVGGRVGGATSIGTCGSEVVAALDVVATLRP